MNTAALKSENRKHERQAAVVVYDIDGNQYTGKSGAPTRFFVIGEYAAAYRKAVRDINREWSDRTAQSTLQTDEQNDLETELFTTRKIAAGVVAWENVEAEDGSEVPFNQKNVVQVLLDAPWVAKRIYAAIIGHSSFFPSASSS